MKPEKDFIFTLLITCMGSSEILVRVQHRAAIASEHCLGSYSMGGVFWVFLKLFLNILQKENINIFLKSF